MLDADRLYVGGYSGSILDQDLESVLESPPGIADTIDIVHDSTHIFFARSTDIKKARKCGGSVTIKVGVQIGLEIDDTRLFVSDGRKIFTLLK